METRRELLGGAAVVAALGAIAMTGTDVLAGSPDPAIHDEHWRPAVVPRVVAGDLVDAVIWLDFGVQAEQQLHIAGVSIPPEKAAAAKAFTAQWLRDHAAHNKLTVHFGPWQQPAWNVQSTEAKDAQGRPLVRLACQVDHDLDVFLIANHLADPAKG
jgi:hypothetical protein